MITHGTRNGRRRQRRQWPATHLAIGTVMFLALGGSAAAGSLIKTDDLATGAVTGSKIKNGSVKLWDLTAWTRDSLHGDDGKTGASGAVGDTGLTGPAGGTGPAGSNGAAGTDGSAGTNGSAGADGTDGSNGTDGTAGTAGTDGIDGINGTHGTDGTDGIIAPLSATAGETALLTATPPTVVVELTVPAGNYVVLAKSQISHTGAGDSVECVLKAGTAAIDRVAMKTMPALAAIPMSMQAITTSTPTHFSVECDVFTAGGSADYSSLIAIPIG